MFKNFPTLSDDQFRKIIKNVLLFERLWIIGGKIKKL